jgi:hypothetical protein
MVVLTGQNQGLSLQNIHLTTDKLVEVAAIITQEDNRVLHFIAEEANVNNYMSATDYKNRAPRAMYQANDLFAFNFSHNPGMVIPELFPHLRSIKTYEDSFGGIVGDKDKAIVSAALSELVNNEDHSTFFKIYLLEGDTYQAYKIALWRV